LSRDDHLSHPVPIFAELNARHACADRDATIPEDQRAGCPPSVLSCTAWGFSCLANYSASGELLPRLFNLACAFVAKEPAVSFLRHLPSPQFCNRSARVFYAACRRMVFGLSSSKPLRLTSDHLPSTFNLSQSKGHER